MKLRHSILLLGVCMIAIGASHGSWAYLLVWLGLDFIVVAIGHAKGLSTVMGKGASGRISAWSWIVFFPLHLYSLLVWHAYRVINREGAYQCVTDDLIVGRRLLGREMDFTVDHYIDLTAEFTEPARIREASSYRAFPILDGSVPNSTELHRFLAGLKPGRTYIHCAQGHGRTGVVAVAYLLSSGQAKDAADGYERLKKVRPKLRLNREQLNFVRDYEKQKLLDRADG